MQPDDNFQAHSKKCSVITADNILNLVTRRNTHILGKEGRKVFLTFNFLKIMRG